MRESSENIMRTIDLSRQLLYAADLGDLACEDDRCSLLYGIVRDSAYKILNEAERERERHINRGIWDHETGNSGAPVPANGKKGNSK